MVTEVIMKRELFGCEISQKSKSGMFSATELALAGNKWRIANDLNLFSIRTWLAKNSTKEFIKEIEEHYGTAIVRSRGKNSQTWVHPFLFIDMALAISPTLKIEVYQWLYDELIKYRNNSGDSFKKMTGALYENSTNKREFPHEVKKIASHIKQQCEVEDWESATEDKLKLRDKMHENIALLCDVVPNDNAVKIGIKKALEGK